MFPVIALVSSVMHQEIARVVAQQVLIRVVCAVPHMRVLLLLSRPLRRALRPFDHLVVLS